MSNVISFNLDFSEVNHLGQQLLRAQALIDRDLEITMSRVISKAELEAKGNAKRDTGDLQRRITGKVSRIPHGVRGEIGSNAPHAAATEEGREPGSKMPPPGALLGWMARHNIPVAVRKPGKGFRRVKDSTGETVGFSTRAKKASGGYWPIEYLIARKIKTNPAPGDHNMRNAIKSVEGFARSEFAQVGPRVIRRIVKGAT